MRPDFIPREVFRAYLTRTQLNKHATFDGIAPSSYIGRWENLGNPLPMKMVGGSKCWRLIDLFVRAKANGHRVDQQREVLLRQDIDSLKAEKASIETQVNRCRHVLAMNDASSRLTGSTLLNEQEIVAGQLELPFISGVYFLIRGAKVVYVGQSLNVFSRVVSHMGAKAFDTFAYIPCEPGALDALESLYIHTLRPEHNGRWNDRTGMHAPLRLDSLLSLKQVPAPEVARKQYSARKGK